MKGLAPWLSLFASTGTLLCCALPALLVTLGMGATLASLVTAFPQLIWISQYKGLVFSTSAVLMALAAYGHYRARNLPCPLDEQQARACSRSRRWSLIILALSGFLWLVGAFFAFAAPRFLGP